MRHGSIAEQLAAFRDVPPKHKAANDNKPRNAPAYRGTLHLLELGHKDITLLTASTHHAHLLDRVEGYRRALAEAGLSAFERILFGGGTVEGCRHRATAGECRLGDRQRQRAASANLRRLYSGDPNERHPGLRCA